jgi:hypothetical protein
MGKEVQSGMTIDDAAIKNKEPQVPIAKTDLVFLQPSGTKTNATVGISAPVSVDEGHSFQCRVFFGHFDEPKDITGIDSLQAVCLALIQLKRRLKAYEDELGWKIYFAEEGSELSLCDPELEFSVDAHFG